LFLKVSLALWEPQSRCPLYSDRLLGPNRDEQWTRKHQLLQIHHQYRRCRFWNKNRIQADHFWFFILYAMGRKQNMFRSYWKS
jgi:hypothetical protein